MIMGTLKHVAKVEHKLLQKGMIKTSKALSATAAAQAAILMMMPECKPLKYFIASNNIHKLN